MLEREPEGWASHLEPPAAQQRAVAASLREDGARMLRLLNDLLWTASRQSLQSPPFEAPLEDLASRAGALIERFGRLDVHVADGRVYVNGVRVPLEPGIRDIVERLRHHEAEGLVWKQAPSALELCRLLTLIAPPAPGESAPADLPAELAAELPGVELRRPGDPVKEPPFPPPRASPPPAPAPDPIADPERAVEELLEAPADGLAESASLSPAEAHARRVGRLALILGRRLGLPSAWLKDLGIAALRHHGGTERVGASLRETLAVLDYQRPYDDPRGHPSLLGRILAVAEDYDAGCHAGGGLTPDEVLARMAGGAGTLYDPAVLQSFVNALGRYPLGTRLRLQDGREGVVASVVQNAKAFDRPTVRIERLADGSLSADEILVDLARKRLAFEVVKPEASGAATTAPEPAAPAPEPSSPPPSASSAAPESPAVQPVPSMDAAPQDVATPPTPPPTAVEESAPPVPPAEVAKEPAPVPPPPEPEPGPTLEPSPVAVSATPPPAPEVAPTVPAPEPIADTIPPEPAAPEPAASEPATAAAPPEPSPAPPEEPAPATAVAEPPAPPAAEVPPPPVPAIPPAIPAARGPVAAPSGPAAAGELVGLGVSPELGGEARALYQGVLPEVLRELYVGGRTGTLDLKRAGEVRSLRFWKGNVVHGRSNVTEEHMGEVAVREGLLSAKDLERANAVTAKKRLRLGQVLKDLRIMTDAQVEELVALHARVVLEKAFRWNDGVYDFQPHPPDPTWFEEMTLRLSTAEIILDAVRTLVDPDVVRYHLADIDRILVLSAHPLHRIHKPRLTAIEEVVLGQVDGVRSAREVMRLAGGDAREAQKALFGLLCTGRLQYVLAGS